ncbi:MAG: VWA domain-containing protein [Puniceicoccales bacterium]|jgi:Ca-activated chloride channel family protein|nr:VWA domain-containing protein [Puniceicoccales bacterium]
MASYRLFSPFWLLLLLLLPLLYESLRRFRRPSVRFPSLWPMQKGHSSPQSTPQRILFALRAWGLIFLIFALARPQHVEKSQETHQDAVDIVIALDLSSSMTALDFWEPSKPLVTRLDVAKKLTAEFIEKRPHDRIGLIGFASESYVVSPVTFNHEWLIQNLERLHIGSIPDGTAIGSAILAGCNRLRDMEAKSKILILLTDGINNRGNVSPEIAAEAAARYGIKIYSIGIGKEGVVPILMVGQDGNPIVNRFGEPQIVQAELSLDTAVLQKIAETTQGRFFHAHNHKEFSEIYRTIDEQEKTEIELQAYVETKEYFAIFVLIAWMFLLLELVLRYSLWRVLP